MNDYDKAIRKALDFDPLAEAEAYCKKVGHEDAAMGLGLLLTMNSVKEKDSLLSVMGDSTFSMATKDYRKLIEREGFKLLLDVPFKGAYDHDEHLFIYWHDDGLLLPFDTSCAVDRNAAHLYFNHKKSDPKTWLHGVSGCEIGDGVFVGGFDAREALFFRLREMRSMGSFLRSWVERPFLWLLTYMEGREQARDFEKITHDRLALLPPEIVARIAGQSLPSK